MPLLGGKAIILGLKVRLTSPRLASHVRLNSVFSSTSSTNAANSEELKTVKVLKLMTHISFVGKYWVTLMINPIEDCVQISGQHKSPKILEV